MTDTCLIAVDLDGTLLNQDKFISETTRKALIAAQQQGHKVVIATGRPYRASQMYYQELSLDTPVVNFNGAFVHHPLDKGWGVFHAPLKLDSALAVIDTCEAFQVKNIIVEVVDDVYLKHHDQYVADAFQEGNPTLRFGDLHHLLHDNPTSLLIHPQDYHVRRLRHALEQVHAEIIEQRTWGAPWNLIEIVKKGMNKAVGLKRIAESYNIPKERVIAFGDEDNDLEMIEYAGHGVAMGNAIDELKDIADSITQSNDEDGIASYLRKVL